MMWHGELEAYAQRLEQAGFAIYEPTGRMPSRHFRYSRVVDGKECFGSIDAGYYGGFSHIMPIKSSIEHGSSMWVDGVPDSRPESTHHVAGDPLTVEAAEKVASPSNYNPLVGRQHNYEDTRFSHLYQRREAAL